jgi:hypothetical protein
MRSAIGIDSVPAEQSAQDIDANAVKAPSSAMENEWRMHPRRWDSVAKAHPTVDTEVDEVKTLVKATGSE